jgi:hypothetical protein
MIHPDVQKMKEIVEIDFPIGFRVRREWQVFPRLLARNSRSQPCLIDLTSRSLKLLFGIRKEVPILMTKKSNASLLVLSRLAAPLVRRSPLCGVDRDRISGGIFVNICGSMSNPLPPDIHWGSHVKFDLTHFKWSRVGMPHEISD